MPWQQNAATASILSELSMSNNKMVREHYVIGSRKEESAIKEYKSALKSHIMATSMRIYIYRFKNLGGRLRKKLVNYVRDRLLS